jgi:polyhydroxyalkanoate synthase
MGYCLGGTLPPLPRPRWPVVNWTAPAAAAAGFAEPAGGADRFLRARRTGPLHRREPGRLLDAITREQGFLSGEQMAGSFQFLHSRDLVWTRRMREYLMGETPARSDLMAWNADTTRLPARMHHEYLTALYLRNALATGRYPVQGRPVSLSDLQCRCSWSAPSATMSRPGVRSTSCTACARPK